MNEEVEKMLKQVEAKEPPTQTTQESSNGSSGQTHSSKTLASLEATRRPKKPTTCEHCHAAIWFSSPEELKCWCRLMSGIVWTTKEPTELTSCDGVEIAQQQQQNQHP